MQSPLISPPTHNQAYSLTQNKMNKTTDKPYNVKTEYFSTAQEFDKRTHFQEQIFPQTEVSARTGLLRGFQHTRGDKLECFTIIA